MKKRYGSLYENFKCPTCNNAEETYVHIWTCPNNIELVETIIHEVADSTLDTFKDSFAVIPEMVTASQIVDVLSPTNIPEFLPDLARGFTIRPFERLVERLLDTKSKASKVINFISSELRRRFRTDIWLPRCSCQIKKEKASGLSKRQKRSAPTAFNQADFPSQEDYLRNRVQRNDLAVRWFDSQIQNGRSATWITHW